MGSAVRLHTTSLPASEILPRVEEAQLNNLPVYGIAVGGDIDGIYGDGSNAGGEAIEAAVAGEAVVVVTQGRALARVFAQDFGTNDIQVDPGDILILGSTIAGQEGTLIPGKLDGGGFVSPIQVVAVALQTIPAGSLDIIAVDFQREGRHIGM